MAGLIVENGRVIDPGRGIDGPGVVAFGDGKVVEADILGDDAEVFDASGLIVIPGIIDMHAHVYWGGTSLGIDGDALARTSGTTTWVDVGSAGAGNFEGFRQHVIAGSETRILTLLHVSFAGIYGFSGEVMVGESLNRDMLHPESCARVALQYPDLIRGVKVRIGWRTSGVNGLTALQLAIQAAERANLPVMCHIDEPPPTYAEVCQTLRPGDVLTHCFRPYPNAPCHADGRVRDAVIEARERGVLFDIAHGKGSFSWDTAEKMVKAGFWPDVISSDVHTLCIDGPAYDNLITMEKFLYLGMELPEVVRAVTQTPAAWLRRPDLGDLSLGSTGDATVLRRVDKPRTLTDVLGVSVEAKERLEVAAVIVDGKLWHVAGG
ncbi:MAG: amidohydrolase/deacetylase family metallohydrolase [Geminicoccaceae bacterium]|nr:MAG: amidohydrolase/deacetylase family metallohydrolase [Geminicoccaceae bacterium]